MSRGKTSLTGEAREQMRQHVARLYVDEELSIREISDRFGKSYNWARMLLEEAGVEMRPRGGRKGFRRSAPRPAAVPPERSRAVAVQVREGLRELMEGDPC